MILKIGDTAPSFDLPTMGEDGPERVKLSDLIGDKNLVILFFPAAFTGVCTKELCEISSGISVYGDLKANVVAISGDTPFAQAEWAKKEGISIPLLSDYEHRVAEAYGVAYENFLPQLNLGLAGVAKRSAFVIDKDGKVVHADVQEDPHDLPDFEAVKAALENLA